MGYMMEIKRRRRSRRGIGWREIKRCGVSGIIIVVLCECPTMMMEEGKEGNGGGKGEMEGRYEGRE